MSEPAEKRARTDLVPEHLAEAIRQVLSIEAPDTTAESWEFHISAPHSIETWAASVEGVSGVEGFQGITQAQLASEDLNHTMENQSSLGDAVKAQLPFEDLNHTTEDQSSFDDIENALQAQLLSEDLEHTTEDQSSFNDIENALQAQLLSEHLEHTIQAEPLSEQLEEPHQNNNVFSSLAQPVKNQSSSEQLEQLVTKTTMISNALFEGLEQSVESIPAGQIGKVKDSVALKDQQDVVDKTEGEERNLDPEFVPSVSDLESQGSGEDLEDNISFGQDFIKVNGEHYPIDQYFGNQWDLKIVSWLSWKLLNT
jgi:hypothetical protein